MDQPKYVVYSMAGSKVCFLSCPGYWVFRGNEARLFDIEAEAQEHIDDSSYVRAILGGELSKFLEEGLDDNSKSS
jgi:hypothetical protein